MWLGGACGGWRCQPAETAIARRAGIRYRFNTRRDCHRNEVQRKRLPVRRASAGSTLATRLAGTYRENGEHGTSSDTEARRHGFHSLKNCAKCLRLSILRSHSQRTRLTRRALKNPARAEGAERAELFLVRSRRSVRETSERGWPDAGFGRRSRAHWNWETQALLDWEAFVFSIPVCPSPREARSGQSGLLCVLRGLCARSVCRARCENAVRSSRRAKRRTGAGHETAPQPNPLVTRCLRVEILSRVLSLLR